MDNTELHYVTYDPDEIWVEMLTAYVEAGGDILYPGDEKEMLLRSVQADITQVLAGVDNGLRMQTLRYAVGEYLDLIGETRGCERIQASAATVSVEITANATGEISTLAAGTAMTADGELFFLLDNDVTLTGYAQTITTTATADRTGSASNALLSGTTLALSTANPAVASIVSVSDATGGNEAETDDAYRERIRQRMLVSVTTGPADQYKSAAMAVSSDIIDAKAIAVSPGTVGIYLILADGASAESVISAVGTALSDTDTRPLTDRVTVAQATDISYVLDVQYESDGSAITLSAIADAVTDYQTWQDQVIGRAFNPDRLMAAIYQAGGTRVTWGPNSSFNGSSTITYTEIGSTERCKGSITLGPIPE